MDDHHFTVDDGRRDIQGTDYAGEFPYPVVAVPGVGMRGFPGVHLKPVAIVLDFVEIGPGRSPHLQSRKLGLNERRHATKLTMPD
jgi:hypothetical protein